MKKRKQTNMIFGSFLFLVSLTIHFFVVAAQTNSTTPVKVGVILDDFDSSTNTKVWLSCINMALSDFYGGRGSSATTRLALNIRDSREDVVDAAAAALDLIKNVQVQAILGPKTSMQANFVIDLGDKAQVPIISFSATSSSLTSIRSPYFFRAAHNDSSQVKAISAVIKVFGWREAVPIYVDNEYGEGVIPYLVDALEEVQTRVPYRSVIAPEASEDQIEAALYKLMTMQTRVFIVHMLPSLGARLFAKAEEMDMMNGEYVWIMTGGLTNHITSMNSSVINSMQGALGVRTYVPETTEFVNFRARWKRQFQRENPNVIDAELDVPALWAYDAAFALAMAVENDGSKNFGFQNMNASSSSSSSTNTSTDLEHFGVSENGPQLRQSLSTTQFTGLAGDFSFVDGQLQYSIFEIVNVVGHTAKRIGFWKKQSGLEKKLNLTNTEGPYSTSRSNLGPIIWPGDSTSVPKGWEIPTNGKRLKVGVPVSDAFAEFVRVMRIPSSNTTEVFGFCIDVFKAAIDRLPYAVTYDFVPFAFANGTSAGSYNDLVYQVFLGNFDALAADTTIRGNRSLYVDFTLPYTESGVVMVVPLKDGKSKNAWIFLKPLTWDLWLTSSTFFFFIGFVVWVLEHRINEEFRGPPAHQVGTSFWFSFSTMVFAQREKVISNLARFVVIVWVFVVLILTQSYTASLTSLLTVQQLEPTFTNLSDLINNNEFIGYIEGSFVRDLLIQRGVHPNKLRPYKSSNECHEFLTNGSANGGIAAAIDETPNMKPFLAKYCSKYTMIGPIFKTDGFGFVFPKDSPLVPDMSRAILNVTEGDEMKEIENKWFATEAVCSDTKPTISDSNSLGLDSFRGLFLIAGVSSLSALLIFSASFCYRHWHMFMTKGTSVWIKLKSMLKIFDQKDLSSHTFRKTVCHKGRCDVGATSNEFSSPNPNGTGPPSPAWTGQSSPTLIGHSSHIDSQSPFFRAEGISASEIPSTPHEGTRE